MTFIRFSALAFLVLPMACSVQPSAPADATASAVPSASPTTAPAPKPAPRKESRECGPWFASARLTLVSDDGGVRIRAWARSVREMSAVDAFRIALDDLRDVEIAERDDARLFAHWVDPCARPLAGFIQVKAAGGNHLVVASTWPEGATERLRPVFADLVESFHVFAPGACSSRSWLTQPGQHTFSAARSEYADSFFLESNPLWACSPFVFPVVTAIDDGKAAGPKSPKPTGPFYW